jgi:hypothetical protein
MYSAGNQPFLLTPAEKVGPLGRIGNGLVHLHQGVALGWENVGPLAQKTPQFRPFSHINWQTAKMLLGLQKYCNSARFLLT